MNDLLLIFRKHITILLILLSSTLTYSQGTNCLNANPFCSDQNYNFPNNVNNGTGPTNINYSGCNTSFFSGFGAQQAPNPIWYYFEISESGTIEIEVNQYDTNNNGIDTDFMLWGPFTSVNDGCTQINNGLETIECGISADSYEEITLGLPGGSDNNVLGTEHGLFTPPPAVEGEYYIVMITNFENKPGHFTFEQTGGTGSTDCNIVEEQNCSISNLNANAVCNGQNTTISGSLSLTTTYTTGTLTVSSSCGGSQTFTTFTNPINFSFDGGAGDGSSCTITASFSEDTGCTKTTTVTKPDCGCHLSVTPMSSALCTGETTTLTANEAGGTWSSSVQGVATVNNGVVTAISAGTTTITYSNGSCDVNTTINVTQQVTPTFTEIGEICTGTPFDLPSTSTNNVAGTWSPAIDNTQTTTYTFTPTNSTCTVPVTMTVTVTNSVTPTFNSISPVCAGTTVDLPTISNNNFTGTWSPAFNNQTTTTYTFTADPNQSDCDVNSTTLDVVILPQPNPSFVATPDNGAAPLFVEFANNSSYANVYSWDFGNGTTSNLKDPSTNYLDSGQYIVKLTASNGVCSNSIVDTITVIQLPKSVIEAPNVFTPNGDGVNDEFFIYTENVNSVYVEIFNRWGILVAKLEDDTQKWDGKDATDGVYFYKYKITDLYDQPHEGHGFFHLMR